MSRALHVVGTQDARPAIPRQLSPLMALVALEPVLLAQEDVALIELANDPPEVLGPDEDVSQASAAQMALDWFVEYVGVYRKTDGDRARSMYSHLTRYVMPHLIEVALDQDVHNRTVEVLTFKQARVLAEMLAGRRPWPAATVAGDVLNRSATTCVWLTVAEAAIVSHGGLAAVTEARARGALSAVKDSKGRLLILSADLRRAGLLRERTSPHGITHSSAQNVLHVLKKAMQHASDHGAQIRANFDRVEAIKPLLKDLAHSPRIDPGYLPIEVTAVVAGRLHVVHQLVLWLLRLTGMRIGEAFGLLVGDFVPIADGGWALRVEKQGGEWKLVRSGETGRFEWAPYKGGTKTTDSDRIIRVPDALAALLHEVIAVFHTWDGVVRAENRLIPGLQKDDAAGMSAFRSALTHAQREAGLAHSVPHDMRGFVITDLNNAGVDDRVGYAYVGHTEEKRTVHQRYDDGVPVELQMPATDAITALLAGAGIDTLIVATDRREMWGTSTMLGRHASALRARMAERGWLAAPDWAETDATLMTTGEIAARVARSEVEVRRLLSSGAIRGRKEKVRGVWTWLADGRDVQAYIDSLTGVSLHELAELQGMTYHQMRELCLRLDVLDVRRAKGTAIRLGEEAVACVVADIERRRARSEQVVDLAEAALMLGLPGEKMPSLVRSGHLKQVADLRGGPRRMVTRRSVLQHAETMKHINANRETHFVPIDAARRALGLTRPQMSSLVTLGHLCCVSINRRQHVGLRSALAYVANSVLAESVSNELQGLAICR